MIDVFVHQYDSRYDMASFLLNGKLRVQPFHGSDVYEMNKEVRWPLLPVRLKCVVVLQKPTRRTGSGWSEDVVQGNVCFALASRQAWHGKRALLPNIFNWRRLKILTTITQYANLSWRHGYCWELGSVLNPLMLSRYSAEIRRFHAMKILHQRI